MRFPKLFSADIEPIRGRSVSDHLDLIRGSAAFAVLVGHARALFLVDYATAHSHRLPIQLLYFACAFGHQAVMIFFVLSGYLIGSSVIRALRDETWSWGVYLTNRLTRLMVVLVAALLLGALWDRIGIAAFGSAGIYGGSWPCAGVVSARVMERLTPAVFLGNAFFMQGVWVPTFGSNGPLWSLNYEFWYYIAFALLACGALAAYSRKRSALPFLAFGFGVFLLVGALIAEYFLIWLIGVVVAVLRPSPLLSRRPRTAGLLTALLLFLALFLSRVGMLGGTYSSDFVIAMAFAFLVYSLLHLRTPARRGAYGRIARSFAGFSYTIYLVHLPVLVFLSAMMVHNGRWQPELVHLTFVAVVIAAVLAYSYGIAQLTEARTDAVRRSVNRLLFPKQRAVAAAATTQDNRAA